MQSFRVVSAVFDAEHDRIEVVKEITEDDGTTNLNLHTFHPETLEWKAAEYGIEDLDELLDIVMHEPYMGDSNSLKVTAAEATQNIRTSLAAARTKFEPSKAAKALTKADNKSRLLAAGVPSKYVEAVDVAPRDLILQHCTVDRECVDLKRQYIDRVRRELREEQQAERQQLSSKERAAALAKSLGQTGASRAPHGSVAATEHVQAKPVGRRLDTIELNRGRITRQG